MCDIEFKELLSLFVEERRGKEEHHILMLNSMLDRKIPFVELSFEKKAAGKQRFPLC